MNQNKPTGNESLVKIATEHFRNDWKRLSEEDNWREWVTCLFVFAWMFGVLGLCVELSPLGKWW